MLPQDRNNQKLNELYKLKDEISKASDYVDIFNISNMIDNFMVKYNLRENSPECVYLNKLINIQKLLIRSKKI